MGLCCTEVILMFVRFYQVYQARLRPSGEAVAVKVQRPGVRAAMALDLFILRKMVDYARVFLRLNTDLAVTYHSQN